jgi:GNAT superfamily N-acetyltransferase
MRNFYQWLYESSSPISRTDVHGRNIAWVEYGEWPQPLHPGLRSLLPNSKLLNESVENISYDIKENLDMSDDITISAKIDGQEVGVITASILYDAYEYGFGDDFTEDEFNEIFPDDVIAALRYLDVKPEFRNRGIGGQLFKRMMDHLENSGYTQFYLNASPMGFGGVPLHKLEDIYSRFGFKPLIDQGKNIQMIKII